MAPALHASQNPPHTEVPPPTGPAFGRPGDRLRGGLEAPTALAADPSRLAALALHDEVECADAALVIARHSSEIVLRSPHQVDEHVLEGRLVAAPVMRAGIAERGDRGFELLGVAAAHMERRAEGRHHVDALHL